MLISQFSKVTGLSPDTIRFYIGKGLLKPERSSRGGSNPYQIFRSQDVTTARMIRLQQSLGYSLREIATLNEEYRSGTNSSQRTSDVLRLQISRLEERRADLNSALAFLHGKLAWIENGKSGDTPEWRDYTC
jgi:MerR family copper efflux transcriptional regulator